MEQLYNKKNNKTVLLYSGGMDSYIISKLKDFDTLLYIDINSRYSKTELEIIKQQNIPNLVIDSRLNLGDMEHSTNFIVPARNLFFIIIATYYGDKITMGALSGDRSSDKDIPFSQYSQTLLQHIYKESWWCDGREIEILLPFKNHTKKQIIEEYLNKGFDIKDLIYKSFSCYSPTENGQPCGVCKPCLRKWMSLRTFRNTKDVFFNNPEDIWKVKIKEIEKNLDNPLLCRGEEDRETVEVWNRFYR